MGVPVGVIVGVSDGIGVAVAWGTAVGVEVGSALRHRTTTLAGELVCTFKKHDRAVSIAFLPFDRVADEAPVDLTDAPEHLTTTLAGVLRETVSEQPEGFIEKRLFLVRMAEMFLGAASTAVAPKRETEKVSATTTKPRYLKSFLEFIMRPNLRLIGSRYTRLFFFCRSKLFRTITYNLVSTINVD